MRITIALFLIFILVGCGGSRQESASVLSLTLELDTDTHEMGSNNVHGTAVLRNQTDDEVHVLINDGCPKLDNFYVKITDAAGSVLPTKPLGGKITLEPHLYNLAAYTNLRVHIPNILHTFKFGVDDGFVYVVDEPGDLFATITYRNTVDTHNGSNVWTGEVVSEPVKVSFVKLGV